MKKIYLLLVLFCSLSFSAFSTVWYSRVAGDITVLSNWYSTRSVGGIHPGGFGTSGDTWVVINNMTILGGETWNVAGNVIDSTNHITNSGSAADTIRIGGYLSMVGTTDITTILTSGDLYIYVAGDVSFSGSSYISPATSGIHIYFHFDGGSTQNFSWTSGVNSNYTTLYVDPGATVQLASNIPLPRSSVAADEVMGTGTLNCGTYTMSSANTDAFKIDDDATIITANAGGLDASLQSLSSRTYSGAAHYVFNGTTAQVTGTTMPGTFVSVGAIHGSDTINNAAGVTLSQITTFGIGTSMNLDNGTLANGALLTMLGGSFVNVDNGTFGSTPTYGANVDVTYENLGNGSTALTTGPELQAINIGNLTINKPGAIITLGSGTTVNGNVVLTAGTLDASVTGYTINAKTAWLNNVGISGYNGETAGTVTFTGSGVQHIGGSGITTFQILQVNNSSNGVIIDDDENVNGGLILSSGTVTIGTHTLAFSPGAAASGTFGSLNMIIADGTGVVTMIPNADNENMFYPVGDASTNYTPININVPTGATGGSAFAVNLTATRHPANGNITDYLKRYWSVATGFVSGYNVTATFVAGDVHGSYSNMSMGVYPGALPWIKGSPATSSTISTLAFVVGSADFTGINTAAPTVTVSHDTELCTPLGTTTLNATPGVSDDSIVSYSWSPSTDLSSTSGKSVVVTPTGTPPYVTTYTVTVTDTNGFKGYAVTTVTVNLSPSVVGLTNSSIPPIGSTVPAGVCVGSMLNFYATSFSHITTYSWNGPNGFDSTIGSPAIDSATLAAAGTYTLTVTNGPGIGCSASYTTAVTVNDTPGAVKAFGAGVFCADDSLNASGGTGGIIYFEGSSAFGTDFTTSVSPTAPQYVTTTGTYYFRAKNISGCWGRQDSAVVKINPLPVSTYSVTPDGVTYGGINYPGYYCFGDSGVHIRLSAADSGIVYQADTNGVAYGIPVVAMNYGALDLGLFKGSFAGITYTIHAKNDSTGCSIVMDQTATIYIATQPGQYAFDHTAGHDGGFCSGTSGNDINLTNSDFNFNYQLYNNWLLAGTAQPGVNAPIDFGAYTDSGMYNIIITDVTYGCTDTLADHDSLWKNPLPPVFNVIGGGQECLGGAGVDVKLDSSVATTIYTLYEDGINIYAPTSSVSDTLDFGLVSGPTQLQGVYLYTVMATDTNGCVSNMNGSATVTVNALPTVWNVSLTDGYSESAGYCSDAVDSFVVELNGSDTSDGINHLYISYQLYFNNGSITVPLGAPRMGTGDTLSWGPFSAQGVYTVIATNDTTTCINSMTGSVTISDNPLPLVFAVSGHDTECADGVGYHITLGGSDSVGIWYHVYENGVFLDSVPATGTSLSPLDLGARQVGPGLTAGNYYYTVVATTPQGCSSNMTDSAYIHVNALPNIYDVTGGGAYCTNDTIRYGIGLDSSNTGISYQLFNGTTPVYTLAGTGVHLNYGTTSTPGTYTILATNVSTMCTVNMTGSAVVTPNTIPVRQIVTGAGAYCAGTGGLPIGLNNSEAGINYQLYNHDTAIGALFSSTVSAAFTFGPEVPAGWYKVIATNPVTGCTDQMLDSLLMTVQPLPTIYTIAGGGAYCAGDTGRTIFLSATQPGIDYQLYRGSGILTGSLDHGTGFGVSFGTFTTTGSYTINATNVTTGCTSPMAGSVSISINSLPIAETVTGSATFCQGVGGSHVMLSGSVTDVRYQLYKDSVASGAALYGTTGTSLDFGLETTAGTYTIVASDIITGCKNAMTGTAVIIVNPSPNVYNVSGGGTLCAGGVGHHIFLSGSDTGIRYQMYITGLPIGGPLLGLSSHGSLDFGLETVPGTYHCAALNLATGCVDTMRDTGVIVVFPLPTVYTVTGGGDFCVADTGVHVGISLSDSNVIYELNVDGSPTGSPLLGNGGALDFGLQNTAGTYSVTEINSITTCSVNTLTTVAVNVEPYLTPVVTLTATNGTTIYVGHPDTLVAHVTGAGTPTYQWYINGNMVPGATHDSFVFDIYFNLDSIMCAVTSSGPCGGITTNKYIVLSLVDQVPQVAVNNGDVRLVPNPNKGIFSLKGTLGTTNDEDVEIEVTDMIGQVVYKNKIVAKGGNIDQQVQLSNSLANGMYILNMKTATQNSVFHFVMEQ